MSPELAHITRCLDLHEPDIAAAVVTRASTQALLAHLAACSAPNTGVAKVLLVFARMATTACEWIDGGLSVDLIAKDEATAIETATDLGGGLRERLLPAMTFNAPLAEFTRAIERVPHLVAPLSMGGAKGGAKGGAAGRGQRIRLSASATVRRTSMPPPPIAIAPESLLVRAPAPAAPGPMVPGIILSMLPGAVMPRASTDPPARAASSEPPIKDVDSGWDD